MTNLRALITQLCDELDHNRQCLLDDRRLTHPLADKARAALAEPEPERPTKDELWELWLRLNTESLFRTSPPWEQVPTLPEGHEILAEFPAVVWGWEGDLYYWIIHDPSGRVYIGGTGHGKFYEAEPDELTKQIKELKSYIEATQHALSMFEVKEQDCADCGGPIGQDKGPPDGWQLEDGRTVCHSCCCAVIRQLVNDVLSN